MKYYLAPMEGITGYIYRNSYEKFFIILISTLHLLLFQIKVQALKLKN